MFLRAAQRAFIASESFFLPAAVSPPRRLLVLAALVDLPPLLELPLVAAQRALAEAASLARVAADIGRRRRPLLVTVDPAPLPNKELRRRSRV